MTTFRDPQQVLGRALALSALISALLLMHGLGFGHSTPSSSPTPSVAVAQTGHVGDGHGLGSGTVQAMSAGSSSGGHGEGAEHQGWAQMCLAVLGTVLLAGGLLLRRGRVDRWTLTVGLRRTPGPLLVWTAVPRRAPSLHRLCVMRT